MFSVSSNVLISGVRIIIALSSLLDTDHIWPKLGNPELSLGVVGTGEIGVVDEIVLTPPKPTLPPQPTMTRSQPSTSTKKSKLSPKAPCRATLKAMPSAPLASTSPSAPKPKDSKTAVSQAVLPSANNLNAQLSASEIP
jgi:hypothetical protein